MSDNTLDLDSYLAKAWFYQILLILSRQYLKNMEKINDLNFV